MAQRIVGAALKDPDLVCADRLQRKARSTSSDKSHLWDILLVPQTIRKDVLSVKNMHHKVEEPPSTPPRPRPSHI